MSFGSEIGETTTKQPLPRRFGLKTLFVALTLVAILITFRTLCERESARIRRHADNLNQRMSDAAAAIAKGIDDIPVGTKLLSSLPSSTLPKPIVFPPHQKVVHNRIVDWTVHFAIGPTFQLDVREALETETASELCERLTTHYQDCLAQLPVHGRLRRATDYDLDSTASAEQVAVYLGSSDDLTANAVVLVRVDAPAKIATVQFIAEAMATIP